MPSRSKQQRKESAGSPAPKPQTIRLQRLLASAGFGSRRQCEELIEAGRVEVDGTVVTKLGTTVDPAVNKVRVDGDLLRKQKLVYYAVNKPNGVVTTNSDPHGRPRVVDLVPKGERVFPVGRLDRSSEGLILLTNDGDLAQKLTHPKFGVRKVYRVTVAGRVDPQTMKQMRQGIYIAEGRVQVEGARIFKSRSKATEMEIVLREGKNREIRRILARLGHKVLQLRRIAVGPLRLGDMPPGSYRVVSREEIKKLQTADQPAHDQAGRRSPGARRSAKKGTSTPRAGTKRKGTKTAGGGGSAKKPGLPKRSPARGKLAIDRSMSGESKMGAVIGADPLSDEGVTRKKSASRATGKRRANKTASRSGGGKSKRSTKRRAGAKGSVGRKKASRPKNRSQSNSKKRVVKKRRNKP